MTGQGTCVLGIDPGGTSGLFLAAWKPGQRKPWSWRAWQCDLDSTPQLLLWICDEYTGGLDAIGTEAFDARRRGKMLAGGPSPARMHALITDLGAVAVSRGVPHMTFAPGMVKPWATDRRLEAAGLIAATAGMPKHARDGARVCAYTACSKLGVPDPLSRAGVNA